MGNSNPKEDRTEPSDSEDLIQRQRAELEELRRLRAELEELRRQIEQEELRRQIAEEEVSWFLHMRSPWSARKPPGFITVSEPSDSEDLIQRLRAELEELRRQRAERVFRDDETGSISPSRGSNSSKEKPPDFSNEPEPSDRKDLIQRLRAELEELRRQRAEQEELRRQIEQEELRRQIAELEFSWFLPMRSPLFTRKPPGFSTEPEPSDSEDDETGSISPSRGSNSSKEKPPDFSNEPEPSDRKWK